MGLKSAVVVGLVLMWLTLRKVRQTSPKSAPGIVPGWS